MKHIIWAGVAMTALGMHFEAIGVTALGLLVFTGSTALVVIASGRAR